METQETRINNGVNEIKTDKFIYTHNSKHVFDLYADFEEFKKHLLTYAYTAGGDFVANWANISKDIENTTLNSDEYFIGVNSAYGAHSEKDNFILYTNYGNIIDVCIWPQLGGWYPLVNYIVIKNNRKLNLEQINVLNFIIQPDKYEKINCSHVSSSYINAIINRVIYNYNEPKREDDEELKRQEEKNRRTDEANKESIRKASEDLRKKMCEEYIGFLKSKGIKDGPTMVRWQRGKDKNNDEFKKVVKAYKYLHQDNKCPDFKKDGNKSRKRKSKKKSKSRKRKN